MNKKIKLSLSLLGLLAVSSAIVVPVCLASIQTNKNSNNNDSNNAGNSDIINISQSAVDAFKNSLTKISLDNYREYFDEANIYPISSNAKMSPETASILSNGEIPVNAIKSIAFTENSNTDDGYLNVDVTISLNTPYSYDNQEQIVLTNAPTGIYNPDSPFNESLFIINGNTLQGFTAEGIAYTKNLYVPSKVNYVEIANDYFVNNKLNSKYLSFEYANFVNFSTNYQQLLDCPFEVISFRGNTSFNTFNNFGMFESSPNLVEVDLTDCIKLEGLMWQTFFNCPKLEKVNFTNCTSLAYIGSNTFYKCVSLTELDFSAATLTDVANDAFNGCTALKTIYVKDDASKELILTSLQSSNLTNVSVEIK